MQSEKYDSMCGIRIFSHIALNWHNQNASLKLYITTNLVVALARKVLLTS
jgi:hypothetical protein